ncbi:MAG: hypothetical protein KKF65_07340 [Nanoarchaeota archaeon]|nr:hypothetical protein [Nanoarchaeota archaeon]
MSEFDQEAFNNFIIDNNIIGFFPEAKKLKSGRMSHWYVNWRTPTSDPVLIIDLAYYVLDFANDFSAKSEIPTETFYGVPEGATKIAIVTQLVKVADDVEAKPGQYVLSMGRGSPKPHGDAKDRYFIGMPKGYTAIIEDVTTTGGSLLTTIDNLTDAEVNVAIAIGLTNRMELTLDLKSGVEQAVNEKGVVYKAMSNAHELLPLAFAHALDKGIIKGEQAITIAKSIEKEFDEYGLQPLKLI